MMGHLVAKEMWGNVDIDTVTGRVFVQQDWSYWWRVWPGALPWTYLEKVEFHRRIDRGIWGVWSNRLFLNVAGKTPFTTRRVPVTFDVRWKLGGKSHYSVWAWKVPPGSTPISPVRSNVRFLSRIELSSADTTPSGATNDAGKTTNRFLMSPHEFGHTIGSPDEYNVDSPDPGDTWSIMNIGRQVRSRHLLLLTLSLNSLIPGARFTA